MADTNTKGVFTLGDVRARQVANAWPTTATGVDISFTPNVTIGSANTNILFTIDTKGRYTPGTLLYWSIASNSAAFVQSDFTDRILSGSLSVNAAGQASFVKTFSANTRAAYGVTPNTNFILNLAYGSAQGSNIATTPVIQII